MSLALFWDSRMTLAERWETAKAMYQVGDSFRVIEAELGLSRSSLNRRAMAEKWQKGCLLWLVHEIVRLDQALRELSPVERHAVLKQVNIALAKNKIIHQPHKTKRLSWARTVQ